MLQQLDLSCLFLSRSSPAKPKQAAATAVGLRAKGAWFMTGHGRAHYGALAFPLYGLEAARRGRLVAKGARTSCRLIVEVCLQKYPNSAKRFTRTSKVCETIAKSF